MNKTTVIGTLVIGTLAVLSWLAVRSSHDKYKGNLVQFSPDPCSPDAPIQVRDTQDSKWPIERRREERCPPTPESEEE